MQHEQPDKWLCVECREWFLTCQREAIETRKCVGPCQKWFCGRCVEDKMIAVKAGLGRKDAFVCFTCDAARVPNPRRPPAPPALPTAAVRSDHIQSVTQRGEAVHREVARIAASAGTEVGPARHAEASAETVVPMEAPLSEQVGNAHNVVLTAAQKRKTDHRWSSFWVGREQALKSNPYLVGQKALGKPYLQWPIALGMPPFMEYAAYSFWKVAAACGDGGKLCPAGFLLFDEFYKGSAMKQTDF